MAKDGYVQRIVLAHLVVAASVGIVSAAALHFRFRQRNKKKSSNNNKASSKVVLHPHHHTFAPSLNRTESGRFGKIEKFSDYVARQIGFKDGSECPKLSKLSNEYLKRTKGCDNKIFEYFGNDEDVENLYVKLVEEFERCILSYFAFHWDQASLMIAQALNVDSEQKKLKDFVMEVTR